MCGTLEINISHVSDFVNSCAGTGCVNRTDLGVPSDYSVVESWWEPISEYIAIPARVNKSYVKKVPQIPVLPSYAKPPSQSFWNSFPKNRSVTSVCNPVKTCVLKQYVQVYKNQWSTQSKIMAKIAITNATEGTVTNFKNTLGPLSSKNASSAIRNGEMITDTVADWVQQKFVAGPFFSPPLAGAFVT